MTKRETAINTIKVATKSPVLNNVRLENIKTKALMEEASKYKWVTIKMLNSKDTRKSFSKEEAKVILKSYILNKSKLNGLDLSDTMFASDFNWTNETHLECLKKIACNLGNLLKAIEYIRNVEEKFSNFSMKYNISLKNKGRVLDFQINADSTNIYVDFDYFGIKKDKDIYELKNGIEDMIDDISNEIDNRESIVYLSENFWKYADA